jgi:LysM repeat protein
MVALVASLGPAAGVARADDGYKVRPGDTLWALAPHLGVSWSQLAAANNLPDPDRILAGQTLTVPAGGVAGPVLPPHHSRGPAAHHEVGGPQVAPSAGASRQAPAPVAGSLDRAMSDIFKKHGRYLAQRAKALKISPARAAAIMQVESGGRTYSALTNLPVIRFEPRVFFDLWATTTARRQAFDGRFRIDRTGRAGSGDQFRTGPKAQWRDPHASQDLEWQALAVATSLSNRETAYRSISMGAGQIMGFNHAMYGQPSAVGMFSAFNASAGAQVGSIFDFIGRTPGLVAAVRGGDYARLVQLYNGATPGTPSSLAYQRKLQAAEASYARTSVSRRP